MAIGPKPPRKAGFHESIGARMKPYKQHEKEVINPFERALEQSVIVKNRMQAKREEASPNHGSRTPRRDQAIDLGKAYKRLAPTLDRNEIQPRLSTKRTRKEPI